MRHSDLGCSWTLASSYSWNLLLPIGGLLEGAGTRSSGTSLDWRVVPSSWSWADQLRWHGSVSDLHPKDPKKHHSWWPRSSFREPDHCAWCCGWCCTCSSDSGTSLWWDESEKDLHRGTAAMVELSHIGGVKVSSFHRSGHLIKNISDSLSFPWKIKFHESQRL